MSDLPEHLKKSIKPYVIKYLLPFIKHECVTEAISKIALMSDDVLDRKYQLMHPSEIIRRFMSAENSKYTTKDFIEGTVPENCYDRTLSILIESINKN